MIANPEDGTRVAIAMQLCEELSERWQDRHCIMEVEELPVVVGILEEAARLRGRDVVWFIDNAAVLSALVKGSSRSVDVDRAAAVVSLLSAMLQMRVWFEYIESDANWADFTSRELTVNPWMLQQGYVLRQCSPPSWPWVSSDDSLVSFIRDRVRAALESRERSSGGVRVA